MNNYTSSRFQRRAEDLIKITNEKKGPLTVRTFTHQFLNKQMLRLHEL